MNDEDEIVFLVSLLCSMNHMHFYSPNRESEKNIIVTASLSPFLSELLGWWYGSGMCLVVNFIYYSLFTSFYFIHYFLKFLHFFTENICVSISITTIPSFHSPFSGGILLLFLCTSFNTFSNLHYSLTRSVKRVQKNELKHYLTFLQ